MRILKLTTLRAKILVILLPMIILLLILLSWFTYKNSEELINREIDTKMQFLLNSTIQEMQTTLTAHEKLPLTLARTIEATGDTISKDTMYSLIQQYLTANEETFGLGVWYDPFQYKNYLKYFGSYAYRFNGQILYTEDYNTEQYNYPGQEWYKLGLQTNEKVLWTNPYYDENSKSTILTTIAPFYHYNGKFRGVITANLHFDRLQHIVSNIKVGETGWAFLVDNRGVYIVDKNQDKLLTLKIDEDPNPSLAAVGKQLLAQENGESFFEENGNTYRVYFQEVPLTSWKLALVIPESELLSPLKDLLTKSGIIISLALLFIAGMLYYFSRYITLQIKKVNELASAMAEGDFTKTIDIKSRDELGIMAYHLNRMVISLNGVLKKVHEGSEQVADTSHLLTASTEQTTIAAEEITNAIQQVATGTELQLSRTEESRHKVLSTHQRLQAMSDRIGAVSDATHMTLRSAQAGNTLIGIAVSSIRDMESRTKEAVQLIEQLSVKSKQIDSIIDLVSQIALRTKILALNAGIVASQAGTHGKSFNIIAQEIKSLAENSSKAGRQIQELIGEIQQETAAAAHVMETSREAVAKGRGQAEDANRSFESIVAAVNEITLDTASIASSIQDIHVDMSELVTTIQEITEVSELSARTTGTVSAATEEQMASMQEMSAGSHMLSQLASELKRSVDRFRL